METVGVVGLGVMGQGLARNLLRAGFPLVVYDPRAEATADLVAAGARAATSPRELAAASTICLISLASLPPAAPGAPPVTNPPSSPYVEQMTLGEDGLLAGARPGSVILELCTGDPARIGRLAAAGRERGVTITDAPVSGGISKARDGTLAIMFAGDEATFARCLPVLQAVGQTIVHVGPTGAGHLTKLVNNVVATLNTLALAEGLALAERSGLDPTLALAALNGGAARSWYSETRAPKMLAGRYDDVDQVAYQEDTLTLARQAGERAALPMPLTDLALRLLARARAEGYGLQDCGVVMELYRRPERLGRA